MEVAEAIAEETADPSVLLLLYKGPQNCSESVLITG